MAVSPYLKEAAASLSNCTMVGFHAETKTGAKKPVWTPAVLLYQTSNARESSRYLFLPTRSTVLAFFGHKECYEALPLTGDI